MPFKPSLSTLLGRGAHFVKSNPHSMQTLRSQHSLFTYSVIVTILVDVTEYLTRNDFEEESLTVRRYSLSWWEKRSAKEAHSGRGSLDHISMDLESRPDYEPLGIHFLQLGPTS